MMSFELINLFKDFIDMFLKMDYFTLSFFLIGLVLMVMEIYIPANNKFFVIGISLYIVALISRFLQGGSFLMMYYFIFLMCLLFVSSFLIYIYKYKLLWIKKVENIPLNNYYTDDIISFDFLVGMVGCSSTVLAPSGTIKLGDYNFFVTSIDNSVIDINNKIKIIKVDGNEIFVKKLV